MQAEHVISDMFIMSIVFIVVSLTLDFNWLKEGFNFSFFSRRQYQTQNNRVLKDIYLGQYLLPIEVC